jgi:hypothetical protein
MIYHLIGGKSRLKVALFDGRVELKSTVEGHKIACVREKLRSSFRLNIKVGGVYSVYTFFHLLAKKEGHGVHRESLGHPALKVNRILRCA